MPGLHDHHIHLLSTDAADRSIAVGPEHLSGAEERGGALRDDLVAWFAEAHRHRRPVAVH